MTGAFLWQTTSNQGRWFNASDKVLTFFVLVLFFYQQNVELLLFTFSFTKTVCTLNITKSFLLFNSEFFFIDELNPQVF